MQIIFDDYLVQERSPEIFQKAAIEGLLIRDYLAGEVSLGSLPNL